MTAADVAELLSASAVTSGEIRRAAVHLPKPLRNSLYDDSSSEHRTAEGVFFEALIYEMILAESETADCITAVAAKFSDAEYVPYDKYSPDGLWYSKDGEIRFKVGGRVKAEMDLLITTADGVRVFAEIIVNPAKASGLGPEIAKKKQLLKQFYGEDPQFLLITASSLKEKPEFLMQNDAYAVVPAGNEAYLSIHPGEVLGKKLSPVFSSKRVDGKKW